MTLGELTVVAKPTHFSRVVMVCPPPCAYRESNSRRDPQALLKRSGKFRHVCYDCRQLKGLKAVVGRTLGLPVVLQRGLAWLVGLVQVKQVMYVVLLSITKKS